MLDNVTLERPMPGKPLRGGFRTHFKGRVNTEHSVIYDNIRANIRRHLPQLDRHVPNDYKVALLLGGPSLAHTPIPKGYKIATVNATHDWALDHGLTPSLFMMLDARAHNARFVQRPVKSCRYFLESQVDPKVYDALQDHDVRIFHGAAKEEKKILDRFYMKRWINVPGGGSIGTRAIGLLYTIGVRHILVIGMDGCLVRGKHHAYAQSENDFEAVRKVRVGRRRFQVHGWMIAQADDLLRMVPEFPSDLEIGFEGDGLIPHLIKENATRDKPVRVIVEK